MTDNQSAQIDYLANTVEVLAVENERLREENARLREALKGVIRIADRNTIEFDIARAAIREGVKYG